MKAFSAIGDMRIKNKLILLVLVLTIPMVVLLLLQYQTREAEISRAQNEKHGLEYVVAVNRVLREVQAHRDNTNALMNGDASAADAVAKAKTDVAAALDRLSQVDKKYGKDFKTTEQVAAIRDQWASIVKIPETEHSSYFFEAHNNLVTRSIFPLLYTVGNESGLLQDSEVSSQALILAVTDTLPALTDSFSRATGYGAGVLAAYHGEVPAESHKQYLAAQVAQGRLLSDQFVRNLQTAMTANGDYKTSLEPLVLESSFDRNIFTVTIGSGILTAPTLQLAPSAFLQNGARSIDTTNQVLEEAQGVLGIELDKRISSAQSAMRFAGLAALGGITIALLLVIVIGASITRPMAHLVEVADRMSLGELDVEVDVHGENEIGQLAESLRRMQASLRSAIERLRMRRAA